jgi:uncharacterized protein (UPF0264 family)
MIDQLQLFLMFRIIKMDIESLSCQIDTLMRIQQSFEARIWDLDNPEEENLSFDFSRLVRKAAHIQKIKDIVTNHYATIGDLMEKINGIEQRIAKLEAVTDVADILNY